MIFSANKRHHPLLCLSILSASLHMLPSIRHLVLLFVSHLLKKNALKTIMDTFHRPTVGWMMDQQRSMTMRRGHRMKCIWGYRWGSEHAEEWGDNKFESLHGNMAYAGMWFSDYSQEQEHCHDNRHKRHIGSILAKCQNFHGSAPMNLIDSWKVFYFSLWTVINALITSCGPVCYLSVPVLDYRSNCSCLSCPVPWFVLLSLQWFCYFYLLRI